MAAWNISIGKTSDGRYEVRLSIPGAFGGKYRFTRTLPPDFSDFATDQPSEERNRTWRRPPTSVKHDELLFCAGDIGTLKEIGARLYDTLFRFDFSGTPKDLTDAFLTARAGASHKDEGLGFAIDLSEVPELSRIPWEALYLADGYEELLLGIDTGTNIVRHLESYSDAGLPPAVQHPIRMLVAVANTDSELEAGTEIGNIERRLGSLPREDERYEIATLERATKADLHRRIVKWRPHIVHFIGHGGFMDEKGVIYLHSGKAEGGRVAVNSTALRDLVRNNPPWLVVLNSCLSGAAATADPFAGVAQNLIRANVPFVVAMQAPISDDAAIRFSEDFYEALAGGDTVATAVTRGRNGIHGLEEESLQPELITPVLYSNGRAERIEILPGGRAERIEILSSATGKRIEILEGEANAGRLSRFLADPRVAGMATLVSMIIGLVGVGAAIFLPSSRESVAASAPTEMTSEGEMSSDASRGAGSPRVVGSAANARGARVRESSAEAELAAARQFLHGDSMRRAVGRGYAVLDGGGGRRSGGAGGRGAGPMSFFAWAAARWLQRNSEAVLPPTSASP